MKLRLMVKAAMMRAMSWIQGQSQAGTPGAPADTEGMTVSSLPAVASSSVVTSRASAGMGLRDAVTKALGQNTASAFLMHLVSLARSIILARLLAPEDFGLFGIALMTISAADILLGFQLNVSIIPRAFQSEDEKRRWMNTVWSLELIRSTIVFVICCALAWPVSAYFADSRVLPLLLVASLGTLLWGLTNTGMTLHQRDINFRNYVLWEVLSSLFSLAVTVTLAFYLRTAIALAWGLVLAASLKVVLSYVFHPYRPTWEIDPVAFRGSLGFGVNLLAIGIMTYVTTQFDNLVVGKTLGTGVLGVYLLAYQLAMLPVTLLGNAMNRTMLPVFSKVLRENRARGFEIWGLSVRCAAWLLILICIPFWAERDALIQFVYGQKWAAAGPPLGILIFAGMLRAMTLLSSAMLLALGRPQSDAKAKLVETVTFVALVLGLVKPLGMMGAAWAGVVCYSLALFLRIFSVAKESRDVTGKLMSSLPNLGIGIAAGILVGRVLKAFDASLFLTIPTIALSIVLCAIMLERDAIGFVLGQRRSFPRDVFQP